MARVLKNEARVELTRQVFILENRRKALRAKLEIDFPVFPPKDRIAEIRKVSAKITQINKYINSTVRAF